MKKLHYPMCSEAVKEVDGGKYRCPSCGFRFAAVEEAELPAEALEEGVRLKNYKEWEKAAKGALAARRTAGEAVSS